MRLVKGYPSTASVTFLDGDENPADPDGSAVTYTSTYSNGLPGPNGSAVRTSVGEYRATLTVPIYERLTILWAGTVSGQPATLATTADVVGGRMFTLHELRRWDATLSNKSPQKLRDARDYVEAVFERETGRSFVPAFSRELHAGDGTRDLWLNRPEPISVEYLAIAGFVVADPDIGTDPDKGLRVLVNNGTTWRSTVEIGYVYGRTAVPRDVKLAAFKLARDYVNGSNTRIDDRAYLLTVPDMGTVTLATPGQRGSRTGIPEVDVVLDAWDIRPEGIA